MRFCRSDQDEAGFFRPNMLVKSLCCSTRMTMPQAEAAGGFCARRQEDRRRHRRADELEEKRLLP